MVEIGIVSVCGNTMCYLNYREAEVQLVSRLSLSEKYGSGRTMGTSREEPVKSPWFSLNHISHLATVEIRVVRLGSFQNLYLSFAIVEITHGVTANRYDIL